ncbi:6763_t:CDS:1 [Cetraspora pellucida]|uniref:6763_t:CDS:1 n=1 Tax=Cetraspora pellucida TaxID=1433469 RepID=A0A9N9G887_9GLOM|nr:6763_t:CDS:1 [Cetraspora pellucida]
MSTTVTYSIVSTVNNVTLQLIRFDCGQIYLCFINNRVIFTIPTVRYLLSNGRRRASQTCFILFRNVIQDCVTALNLRVERHDLSRHAGSLWNQLKNCDILLIEEFRRVANLAAQHFYSEIRIVNVNMNIQFMNIPVMNIPATVRPSTNIPIKINDDENVRELLKDLFAEVLPPPDFHQ